MQMRLKLFLVKLRLSVKTHLWLFSKLRYLAAAALVAFLFFELVYWMFNLQVFWTLMTSTQLSFVDKFWLLVGPFTYLQNQNGLTVFLMMVALAIVQGLSLAALVYAIRHQPKTDGKMLGGSAFVGLLAVIGLGCPACGTSLITPIVAIFLSSSAVAVSEQIATIALPLATAVGLYGLYVIGLRLSTIKASQVAFIAEEN